MQFKNETSKNILIRQVDNLRNRTFKWIKIRPTETIEVTRDNEEYAKRKGLTEVSNKPEVKEIKLTESSIGNTQVETKQIDTLKMNELRELGKKYGVKGTSKKELITKIKEAQNK